MSINIVPQSANINITSFKVVSLSVVLYSHATISVDLYCETGFLRNQILTMSGEEYDNWMTDDYLIDYVVEKLGFTKAPHVVEPPVEVVEPPTEPVVVEEKKEE